MATKTEIAAEVAAIEATLAADLAALRRHEMAVKEFEVTLVPMRLSLAQYQQAISSMRAAPVASLSEWRDVSTRLTSASTLIGQVQTSKKEAENAADKVRQRINSTVPRLARLRRLVEEPAVVYDLASRYAAPSGD